MRKLLFSFLSVQCLDNRQAKISFSESAVFLCPALRNGNAGFLAGKQLFNSTHPTISMHCMFTAI
jgi:hypothetical protein